MQLCDAASRLEWACELPPVRRSLIRSRAFRARVIPRCTGNCARHSDALEPDPRCKTVRPQRATQSFSESLHPFYLTIAQYNGTLEPPRWKFFCWIKIGGGGLTRSTSVTPSTFSVTYVVFSRMVRRSDFLLTRLWQPHYVEL